MLVRKDFAWLHKWHWEQIQEGIEAVMIVILFGGDRLYCADLGAWVWEEDGKPIAVASMSTNGEMGEGPSVIGVWVRPERRREGLGKAVMKAAAEELAAMGIVHVSTVSREGKALAASVKKEMGGRLVIDLSV